MKKLFVLTTVLALGALSSFAQGVINANTGSGGGTQVQIQDPNLNSGAVSKIGTPATKVGFLDAGPGQIVAALYAAPTGASLQALQSSVPVWTGTNPTANGVTSQGVISPGTVTLPTPYDGSAAVQFEFYAATSDGKYSGWSSVASIQPTTAAAAGTGTLPAVIWGTTAGFINTMVLTPAPEPATIALGGLGAAALLLFRRRK